MKNLAFLALLLFAASCTSVAKFNSHLEKPLTPAQMHEDVETAHAALRKYHPKLYWFIPQSELNRKFDSLKTALNQPLQPNEFFYQLAPVIGSVKEGHLRLRPLQKKLTKEEEKHFKKLKPLFGSFEYRIFDDRMYILKNKDSIQKIPVGAEVLKINDMPVQQMIEKYRPLMYSDAENTTYQKYSMAKSFFGLYSVDHHLQTQAKLDLKYRDSLHSHLIKRDTLDKFRKDFIAKKKKKTKKPTEEKQKLSPEEQKKKDSLAQRKAEERKVRFVRFLDEDSATAYLKIRKFAGTSKSFYKREFQKIKDAGSKTLVIDLRDNPGGSLHEINDLHGYLTTKEYTLIKPAQMNFSKANLHRDYFRGKPVGVKMALAPFYPIYFVASYFSAHDKNGKHYLSDKAAKPKKPHEDNFEGKVYLLINGGSFSASSVFAAKLKDDERATLIGEETGGHNDGTVAGFYRTVKLPNSKLKLPVSMLVIQPNIEFDGSKKGVTPHIEILERAEDLAVGRDRVMDWVMADISKSVQD